MAQSGRAVRAVARWAMCPRAPGATQRRLTTPNATSGRHLARFARPDCAIEPVRIVSRGASSSALGYSLPQVLPVEIG